MPGDDVEPTGHETDCRGSGHAAADVGDDAAADALTAVQCGATVPHYAADPELAAHRLYHSVSVWHFSA
jgi:hypothetical protein